MKHLNRDWYALLSQRAASRRGGRAFWFVLALFLFTLNLYAPAAPTLAERLLASGIFVLAFGVIWRWTYRGNGEADLGFLPTMLIVFSLMYALVIFTQRALLMTCALGAFLLEEAAVDKALLLSLVGLALIVCGYYWPGRDAVAKFLPKFEMQWRDKNVVEFTALVFMGIGLLMFVLLFQTKLSNTAQAYVSLPSEFFFLSMIVLFILQLEGSLHFIVKILLWGALIPARIFLGVSQGQLGLGMMVVMALVITYATIRRRIPWMVFIVGFGAFMVLQPVKSALRQSIWVNNEMSSAKDVAESDKAAAFLNSTQQGWTFIQTYDLRDVISLATLRLADILIFATVIQRTPMDVPYWGGASYYRLLFAPIPRILYPEKPDYMEGNILAHQYEMIATDNHTTSVNLTQLTEFYGNFGPIGVIVGCLLLGIIYRTINDCFIHERCGMGAIVAGIYLFSHLIDIENAVAEIFGGLWLEAIMVVIFYWGIRFSEAGFQAIRIKRKQDRLVDVAV